MSIKFQLLEISVVQRTRQPKHRNILDKNLFKLASFWHVLKILFVDLTSVPYTQDQNGVLQDGVYHSIITQPQFIESGEFTV